MDFLSRIKGDIECTLNQAVQELDKADCNLKKYLVRITELECLMEAYKPDVHPGELTEDEKRITLNTAKELKQLKEEVEQLKSRWEELTFRRSLLVSIAKRSSQYSTPSSSKTTTSSTSTQEKGLPTEMKKELVEIKHMILLRRRQVNEHSCFRPSMCFPLSAIPWLQTNQNERYIRKSEDELGLLEVTRSDAFSVQFQLYTLMDMTTPDNFLAERYHSMNTLSILENSIQRRYLGINTWYTMWCNSFGIEFLHQIQQKYSKLEIELEDSVLIQAKQVLIGVGRSMVGICAPENEKKETAVYAIEVLLDPNVLIQLPWNNIIFHHWLMTALSVVALYEKFSLEFRHIPIPKDLFESVTNVLLLIKNLKERVILGFIIMFKQVLMYPNIDPQHPKMILEDVVTPTIIPFQNLVEYDDFGNNGFIPRLKTIIYSLQKLISNNTEQECLYVSPESYTIRGDLLLVFMNCCYHFNFWETTGTHAPIPSQILNQINEANIAKELKKNDNAKARIPHNKDVKNFGFEEKCISVHFRDIEIQTDGKSLEQYAANVIYGIVKEKPKLFNRKIKLEEIMQLFPNKITIEDLDASLEDLDVQHRAVLYSIVYTQMYRMLLGHEDCKSRLAHLINSGIITLLQEQVVRIVSALAKMLSLPHLNYTVNVMTENANMIARELEQINRKQNMCTFNWFWSTYQEIIEQQDVTVSKKELNLNLGIDKILKICETRIRKIVINAAYKSFKVYENDGSPFPEWHIVQHILPCHLALFYEYYQESYKSGKKDKIKLANFLKIIDATIKLYEVKYIAWHSKIQPRNETMLEEERVTPHAIEYQALFTYYEELFFRFVTAYIGPCTLCSNAHSFLHDNGCLCEWADEVVATSRAKPLKYFELNRYSINWFKMALDYIKNLYSVTIQIWNPPMPGSTFRCRRLGYLYLHDAVIKFLVVVQKSSYPYNIGGDSKLDKLVKTIHVLDAKDDFMWGYEIVITLMDERGKSVKYLPSFVEEKLKILNEMYVNLYKYRQSVNCTPQIALNHIPAMPTQLQAAVEYFKENNFKAMNEILPLLAASIHLDKDDKKLNVCRNCDKVETKGGQYEPCEKCISDKYPDVNYFCSKACQEKRWSDEHMAEHLEFELGLADFSHLNLD